MWWHRPYIKYPIFISICKQKLPYEYCIVHDKCPERVHYFWRSFLFSAPTWGSIHFSPRFAFDYLKKYRKFDIIILINVILWACHTIWMNSIWPWNTLHLHFWSELHHLLHDPLDKMLAFTINTEEVGRAQFNLATPLMRSLHSTVIPYGS